jgi:D-alanine-D-alanine ligase
VEKPAKIRVAVVFGGGSTEHARSSVGAADVLDALDGDEFEIVPIGVTQEGRWVVSGRVVVVELTDRAPAPVEIVPSAGEVAVVDARTGVSRLVGIDVVFPVLNGAFGEEGTLQGLLEMADLPYVGSGVFASSAAMDHDFSRKLAVAAGLPVAPYVVLRDRDELTADERERLGLPVSVRPARGTGDGGFTTVTDWAQLPVAVAAARAVAAKVVIAADPASATGGRRVTVGVLDDGAESGPETSVPGEFTADGLRVPADLRPDVERQLRELATGAFVALDCAGLARVDFSVSPAGTVTLDRIDTMPGFEPGSPFPVLWEASGVRYQILISRLLQAAVRRGTGLH